jgi:hypothetical protein
VLNTRSPNHSVGSPPKHKPTACRGGDQNLGQEFSGLLTMVRKITSMQILTASFVPVFPFSGASNKFLIMKFHELKRTD